MAENTKIEWADDTFNPWSGCQKVSPGCANCYAEAESSKKRRGAEWGDRSRVLASEAYWSKPLAWNSEALKAYKRRKVFCASTADVFEDRQELDLHRARLFDLIEKTSYLDWLLLTKRDAFSWWSKHVLQQGRAGLYPMWPRNAWLGASVENQQAADERTPWLWRIDAPVRFLSIEPLLGPIKLDLRERWFGGGCEGGCIASDIQLAFDGAERCKKCGYPQSGEIRPAVDWVIVGGESGPKARPMHPDWVRSIRDQCVAAGVRFFFKQWGEWAPKSAVEGGEVAADGFGVLSPDGTWYPSATGWNGREEDPDTHEVAMRRVGKIAASRVLDGRIWSETIDIDRFR